jgi:hypothetical protein
MFSAGMRESGQREIDMDASDCTYAVFRRIIAYLYTNTLDPVDLDRRADGYDDNDDGQEKEKEEEESTLDDYVQLMNAAESFNLPHLKHLAEEQTIAAIDASNVAQLLDAGTLSHACAVCVVSCSASRVLTMLWIANASGGVACVVAGEELLCVSGSKLEAAPARPARRRRPTGRRHPPKDREPPPPHPPPLKPHTHHRTHATAHAPPHAPL